VRYKCKVLSKAKIPAPESWHLNLRRAGHPRITKQWLRKNKAMVEAE